jgi:hypothetical protein
MNTDKTTHLFTRNFLDIERSQIQLGSHPITALTAPPIMNVAELSVIAAAAVVNFTKAAQL